MKSSHPLIASFLSGNDAIPLIFIDIYQNNSEKRDLNYILLYKTTKTLYLCIVKQNKSVHYDTKKYEYRDKS